MKYVPAFLLVFFSVIFTGCFDILEEISFNNDGSGNYSLTFDMNDMINDPFMKEMMLESIKNDANLSPDEDGHLELDSMVYLKDDPQFAKFKNKRTMWESAKMHTLISEEKGKMFINFTFDFSEVGDIETFYKSLNENQESQNTFAGFDQVVGASTFAFKKKSLTRKAVAQSKQTTADMNSDDMAMLKMFMTDAHLKTTYRLPGKVKNSSIPNSQVDNNQVTVTTPLVDIMEGKANMEGEIKFKN